MRSVAAILTILALAGCATGGSARREVNAVVQDEGARQAAVQAAQRGEDSKSALKEGADAASAQAVTPPT